nr:MAG: RNA-dependent RNA polymerase [Pseudoscorpian picorna-like virus 6]
MLLFNNYRFCKSRLYSANQYYRYICSNNRIKTVLKQYLYLLLCIVIFICSLLFYCKLNLYYSINRSFRKMQSISGLEEGGSYDKASKNIILADTRPVLSVEARSEPTKINRLFVGAGQEEEWTLSALSARWQAIGEFKWSASDSDWRVFNYGLLSGLASSPGYYATILKFFTFVRADVIIRVQVNTTKFHTGRLFVCFMPLTKSSEYSMTNIVHLSCVPHVIIDAALSNVAELVIPWAHLQTYITPLRSGKNDDMGKLVIVQATGLHAAVGSSQTVYGTVLMGVRNSELAIPSPLHDIFLLTDDDINSTTPSSSTEAPSRQRRESYDPEREAEYAAFEMGSETSFAQMDEAPTSVNYVNYSIATVGQRVLTIHTNVSNFSQIPSSRSLHSVVSEAWSLVHEMRANGSREVLPPDYRESKDRLLWVRTMASAAAQAVLEQKHPDLLIEILISLARAGEGLLPQGVIINRALEFQKILERSKPQGLNDAKSKKHQFTGKETERLLISDGKTPINVNKAITVTPKTLTSLVTSKPVILKGQYATIRKIKCKAQMDEVVDLVEKAAGVAIDKVASSAKDVTHTGAVWMKSIFRDIFDNPNHPGTYLLTDGGTVVPLCYSSMPFRGVRLTANPVTLASVSDAKDSNVDEMDLRYLMSRPAICAEWKCKDQIVIPVHPLVAVGTKDKHMFPTWLGFYASAFNLWRGRINYKIEFVTSLFTTGRVLVSFIPELQKISQIASLESFPSMIMDLHEARTFEFSVPYISVSTYKFVPNIIFKPDTRDFVYSVDTCTGVLVFKILNEIVTTSSVSDYCRMWIWCSAGDDFQVAVPRTIDSTTLPRPRDTVGMPTNYSYVINWPESLKDKTPARTGREIPIIRDPFYASSAQDEFVTAEQAIAQMAEPQTLTAVTSKLKVTDLFQSPSVVENYVGESFMHLKYILSRGTLLYTWDVTEKEGGLDILVTPNPLASKPALNKHYITLIQYLSNPFALWRGSLRYTIQFPWSKFDTGMTSVEYKHYPHIPTSEPITTTSTWSSPRSWVASNVYGKSHSTSIEVEVPYQSVYERLSVPSRLKNVECTNGSVLFQYWGNEKISKGIALVYISAGDDFTLFYPVCPPVISDHFDALRDPTAFQSENIIALSNPMLVHHMGTLSEPAKAQMFDGSYDMMEMVYTAGSVVAMSAALSVGYRIFQTIHGGLDKVDQTVAQIPTIYDLALDYLDVDYKAFIKSFGFTCADLMVLIIDLFLISNKIQYATWLCRANIIFGRSVNVAHMLKAVTHFTKLVNDMGPAAPAHPEMCNAQMDEVGIDSSCILIGTGVLLFLITGQCMEGGKFATYSKGLTARLKLLGGISLSIAALARAAPLIKTVIDYILYDGIGMISPQQQAINQLRAMSDEMCDWATRVLQLHNDHDMDLIMYTQSLQDEVSELRHKGLQYMRHVNNPQIDNGLKATVRMVFRQCKELYDVSLRGRDNTQRRREPFVISLAGKPGVGKTHILREILKECMSIDRPASDSDFYNRSCEDAYWSGYAQQYSVIYDDFGKTNPDISASPAYSEFINVKSGESYPLNMADLNSKGKYFTSRLIGMTTNSSHWTPNSLLEPDAFLRRRDILVKVESRIGIITTSNLPRNNDHLRFRIMDPLLPSGVSKGVLTYKEFVEYAKSKYTDWIHKERVRLGEIFLDDEMEPAVGQSDEAADDSDPPPSVSSDVAEIILNPDAEVPENLVDELETLLEWAYRRGKDVVEYVRDISGAHIVTDMRSRLTALTSWQAFIQRVKDNAWMIAGIAAAVAVPLALLFSQRNAGETLDPVLQEDDEYARARMQGGGNPSSNPEDFRHVRRERTRVFRGCTSARAQVGVSDAKARAILGVLVNGNIIRLESIGKTGKPRRINGVGIVGRLVILPSHFFIELERGAFITVKRHGMDPVRISYDPANLSRVDDQDVAMYELPSSIPCFRDIRKHFVSESDLAKGNKWEGTLVTPRDTNYILFDSIVEPIDVCTGITGAAYSVYDRDFETLHGFRYVARTEMGDCGSPLILNEPKMIGKICGIHVAQSCRSTRCFADCVTTEIIEELCTLYREQVQPPPEEDNAMIAQFDEGEEPKIHLHGNFTILGKLNSPVYVNTKTDIRPSLICGELSEPVTEPAALRNSDPRVKVSGSLLGRALDKYGSVLDPWPPDDVKRVTEHLITRMRGLACLNNREIYGIREAIDGKEGDPFYKKMDRSTSPGYPYKLQNMSKEACLDGDHYNHMTDRLNRRLRLARRGQRMDSYWLDCLKDERRPIQKIIEGKTRAFCIAPVDHVVAVRMYFMDFIANCVYNCNNFFCTIGINPESYAWHDLYTTLTCFSNDAFDADYSGFDGQIDPVLMDAFTDVVNGWYNDGDENALIRRVLIDECIHTRAFAIDLAYEKHRGNPSGCAVTTVLNCFINAMLVRLAWMTDRRRRKLSVSLEIFDQTILDRNYGDDLVVVVKRDLDPGFDPNGLAEALLKFGVVITGAKKDGSIGWQPVKDLSFLKRSFVASDIYRGKMIGALAKDTIMELFNWVKGPGDKDQLEVNIETAMRYAAHWGKDYYELLTTRVHRIALDFDLKVAIPSHREQMAAIYE